MRVASPRSSSATESHTNSAFGSCGMNPWLSRSGAFMRPRSGRIVPAASASRVDFPNRCRHNSAAGAFLHGKVAALKDEGCFTLVTKRSVANLQNWFVSALNWGFSGRCRDVYLRRGECRFLKLAVLQGEPLRGVGCHKLGARAVASTVMPSSRLMRHAAPVNGRPRGLADWWVRRAGAGKGAGEYAGKSQQLLLPS